MQKVLPREWLTPGSRRRAFQNIYESYSSSALYLFFIHLLYYCLHWRAALRPGSEPTDRTLYRRTEQGPVKESRHAKNIHCGMILGKHSFPIYSFTGGVFFGYFQKSYSCSEVEWWHLANGIYFQLFTSCWLGRDRGLNIWKTTCGWVGRWMDDTLLNCSSLGRTIEYQWNGTSRRWVVSFCTTFEFRFHERERCNWSTPTHTPTVQSRLSGIHMNKCKRDSKLCSLASLFVSHSFIPAIAAVVVTYVYLYVKGPGAANVSIVRLRCHRYPVG